MLPDWVSNPGPLTYESSALPIALRGPATSFSEANKKVNETKIGKDMLVHNAATSLLNMTTEIQKLGRKPFPGGKQGKL